MRVHPAPSPPPRRRRYDAAPRQKRLRRLPHVFEKVLELPFRSDADVAVRETLRSFTFSVPTAEILGVRADAVEIHPGVTKVVIRGTELEDGEMEMDVWRFRLPECTRPERATAVYGQGELVVTVPKELRDGRLVLVQ